MPKNKIDQNKKENIDKTPEESELVVKEDVKKKENNQMFWVMFTLITIFLIFLAIFLVPYIYKNYINKFTYSGFTYDKMKQGDILLYHTLLPVFDSKSNLIGTYDMVFRNDPRELAKIPLTYNGDYELKFLSKNYTYISIDPNMSICADNTRSLFALSAFLTDSHLDIKAAMSDKDLAAKSNYPFANCRNSSKNTVIIIQSGNSTQITQNLTNCYILTYKDCEIDKVTERFMLEVVDGFANKSSKNIEKFQSGYYGPLNFSNETTIKNPNPIS